MRPHFKSAGISLAILLGVQVAPLVTLRESGIAGQQPATAQTSQDRKAEADRLLEQGNQQAGQEKYPAALESFQKALEIYQAIQDRKGEGYALWGIGYVYLGMKNYEQAIFYQQQALTISREIKEPDLEAGALTILGNAYIASKDYQKAIEVALQGLEMARSTKNSDGEMGALFILTVAYASLKDPHKTIEFGQQSLTVSRQASNTFIEVNTLTLLGAAHTELEEYEKSVEIYQQALKITRELERGDLELELLSILGLTYGYKLWDLPEAIKYLQQALAISQNTQAQTSEAWILVWLSDLYWMTGKYSQALKSGEKGRLIGQQINDPNIEGAAILRLSAAYYGLGDYPKGIEAARQALVVALKNGNSILEGQALAFLGVFYTEAEVYEKAHEVAQQSLIIARKIENQSLEELSLYVLGATYQKQGQMDQAISAYRSILDKNSIYFYRATVGLAQVYQDMDQPVIAIAYYKQGINGFERIRNNIRRAEPDSQQSFLQSIQGIGRQKTSEAYRQLADLLLQQDRVLEAQAVLDLLKVQELSDYLRNVRGNAQTAQGIDVLRPEAEILKKYGALQEQAVKLGKELIDLRKVPEVQRTPIQQQRIAQLVQLETDLNRQFNQFLDSDDIQDLVSQLSRTTRRQSINLEDLNTLRNDLKQAGNAVLLYPLILDDRLELIITTPDAPPLRRTVQVTREELNKTIVEFRSAITDESVDPKPAAQKLYKLLIEPIEQDLQASNAQTILYAPDGQLRYVPLAALYDGKQWLAERYRINNITARSLTDFTSKPAQQMRILAGAFVQGSYNIQVGERSFALGGLPFAGKEVQQLAALIPNTRTLVDQNFSRQQALPKLGDATIVHLATHATFVSGQPEDSFILLGNGDRISLREVQDLSLQNVDLVVLSACQTGVGGILGNGEEILGLGYQFQRAGARATIASLWFVNDESTQQLMQVFYANLKQGKSKTEAMRQAQMALILQGGEFDHPLYWAPFILIGNGL